MRAIRYKGIEAEKEIFVATIPREKGNPDAGWSDWQFDWNDPAKLNLFFRLSDIRLILGPTIQLATEQAEQAITSLEELVAGNEYALEVIFGLITQESSTEKRVPISTNPLVEDILAFAKDHQIKITYGGDSG